MYKIMRAKTEEAYKTFKRTGVRPKFSTGELRVMTAKALWSAWKDVLEQKTIVRSFERTGFSLQIDGSEDATKMKFQGQGVGIPTGLEYENPI